MNISVNHRIFKELLKDIHSNYQGTLALNMLQLLWISTTSVLARWPTLPSSRLIYQHRISYREWCTSSPHCRINSTYLDFPRSFSGIVSLIFVLKKCKKKIKPLNDTANWWGLHIPKPKNFWLTNIFSYNSLSDFKIGRLNHIWFKLLSSNLLAYSTDVFQKIIQQKFRCIMELTTGIS